MLQRYYEVAPARERGLKYQLALAVINTIKSRSREGAWIEMSVVIPFGIVYTSRSREGAWIEIIDH